jgi:uncharacterized protein (TIGR02001 family)
VPVRAPWRVTADRRSRLNRPTALRVVALWLLFLSSHVSAQFSGNASLVSDYRYRGVSLSDNKPAAQLGVVYDDASGWYGGAFASTVQLVYPTKRELQVVSFVGYARRMPSGLSWEAGANYSVVTGPQSYSYPQVYLGVASENVSARLYYAPRYFGQDANVIYGEIAASRPLLDRVRLVMHGGVLQNNSAGAYYPQPDHHVFDVSVGLALDLDQFNVQLTWVGISSANAPYPVTETGSKKNSAVLTLSWSF